MKNKYEGIYCDPDEIGRLQYIAETEPLQKGTDGKYQSTTFYQCDLCLLFYKSRNEWHQSDPNNYTATCELYDTKLTKEEIKNLAKKSLGDIPKNLEEKITQGRK